MAEIAHEHGIWFHVDGAYGGWGMLDERVEAAYGDRGAYDSFAVDPHKWLAAPVGTGFAVCRDGELLSRAFTIEPGHYDRERRGADDDGSDAASPWESRSAAARPTGASTSRPPREASRSGRCSRRWARRACASGSAATTTSRAWWPPRCASGRAGARLLTSRSCRSAASATGHPTGRMTSAWTQLNAAILAELRREGQSLPSSTRVNDAFAIRACFINPRNDLEHVELLVDDVLRIGRALSAEGAG